MYPEARPVALVLAVLLKRSGKTRGRVSETTFRKISNRVTLRDAFTLNVRSWLEEFGVLIVKLPRGGFALVSIAALEGAPSLKWKDFVGPEQKALKTGTLDEESLMRELGLDAENDDEEGEEFA